MADPSLSAPVSKALARLQDALDAGSAYEGQQVAKAVAARMRSRGSKEEAADLLGRAAEAQLRAGQVRDEGRLSYKRRRRRRTRGRVCGEREQESARGKRGARQRKPLRSIDWRSPTEREKEKLNLDLPHQQTPSKTKTKTQITCGSELASNLLDDYEKDAVKLPGDAKADPSGVIPEAPPGGPPAAVARLLRILDAFASSPPSSSSSSSSAAAGAAGAASSSCSSPASASARPDATSSFVAAARFASAATRWASGAGGGKELQGKLHLACAAALSSTAANSSSTSEAPTSSSGPAAAWGAAAPHWARATAAAPETVAQALDAAARQSDSDGDDGGGGGGGAGKERSAFLARAALAQVAARCGSSPHEASDAVKGAQRLAKEFRKLSNNPNKTDALDSFLDLFLEALAKGSPPLASLAAREYGAVVETVPGLSACVDAAGSAAFEAIFGRADQGSGGAQGGPLGGLAALLGGGGGGGAGGGGPDLGAMLGAMLGGGGGGGGAGAGGGAGGLGDLMAMLQGGR